MGFYCLNAGGCARNKGYSSTLRAFKTHSEQQVPPAPPNMPLQLLESARAVVNGMLTGLVWFSLLVL